MDPDPVCPERLDPDPVFERLDPDPVNIRPDPQPCSLISILINLKTCVFLFQIPESSATLLSRSIAPNSDKTCFDSGRMISFYQRITIKLCKRNDEGDVIVENWSKSCLKKCLARIKNL